MAVASTSTVLTIERGHGSLAYPFVINFNRQNNGVAVDVSVGYTYSCRFQDAAGVTVTAAVSMTGAATGLVVFTFSDAQVQTMQLGIGQGQIDEIVGAVVVYSAQFKAAVSDVVP